MPRMNAAGQLIGSKNAFYGSLTWQGMQYDSEASNSNFEVALRQCKIDTSLPCRPDGIYRDHPRGRLRQNNLQEPSLKQ